VVRRADGSPFVKVLDFGIAKMIDELRLTHSQNVLGSPQFMSPEQVTTPKDIDARSDIWSLGVTLYHVLARRLPFPSAQITELAVMITTQPPAPLDVDPALGGVISRCLEKNRASRWQDVAQLADALAPFGGPLARAHADLVRMSPGMAPAPVMRPVAQHDPTVASVAKPFGQHDPTVASIASAPARRKRPAWLVPIVALGALAVGSAGGYFALRGGSQRATPDAATIATVTPDATPEVTPDAPVLGAALEEYEKGLLDLEDRMRKFANDPPTVQAMLRSAVEMSCVMKQPVRAKRYFSQITKRELADAVRAACREQGIEL
jgi:serine/threonine-protein kinase